MKTKNYILLFLMLLGSYITSYAQGQLTGGVQTTSLSASIAHWTQSTSDMNRNYYAIASWNGDSSICGNYLRIYDAVTFNPTSPQVQISTHHQFTRVRIDNSNNIYVLYTDKTSPTSTVYRTYVKKYNTSGTQIGSRIEVMNNTHATDIEIAPNGDVIVGLTNGSGAYIKIFSSSLVFKGYKFIGSITPITNIKPFVIQMDMKGSKLVIGYSYGYYGSGTLKINRYNYSPVFSLFVNQSTLYSSYTEGGIGLEGGNNKIALRNNWEVFYSTLKRQYPNPIIYKVKKLSSGGSSVFQSSNTSEMVDVDISNRLLVSKNYGSPASGNYKVSLYSSSNSLIHIYVPDSKIKNHLSSLAIYNCEFVVTGIDRKLGGNPYGYTYESFHQLFNCQDCRPNMGATAVASFRYPNQVVQVPSYYGPLDVTELCLVDDLLVDGSLSSCETGYFVELSEFNPTTWSDINVLHSGWVSSLTQAPNNINIVDFLPAGYHLRPGKIYRFKLAVGSPWDSTTIFFKVSCCKRKIILEEVDYEEIKWKTNSETQENGDIKEIKEEGITVKVFPNPVGDVLSLESNHQKIVSYQVVDINGEMIFSKTLDKKEDLESIMVNRIKKGVYLLVLLDEDGNKSTTKFIKK